MSARIGAGPDSERRCRLETCFAPETPCNLGHDLSECQYFSESASAATAEKTVGAAAESTATTEAPPERAAHTDERLLPWSGSSFGTADFAFVAARSAPRVLGLVGNHNAGKTTLLSVLYLLVHRGLLPQGRAFAGSFTLGGWEALAHNLRWSAGQVPHFPPHTPRGMRRVPGLLHLAFRRPIAEHGRILGDLLEDVLLTDPPGEWFGAWAVDKDAPSAEGARWISSQSDALALLVDCEALAGADRGAAREQLLRLSQRLSSNARGKRTAVVWTKSDIPVSEHMRAAITAALHNDLPGHQSFAVQVPVAAADGTAAETERVFLDLFTWLLDSPPHAEPIGELTDGTNAHLNARDPFVMYRGRR